MSNTNRLMLVTDLSILRGKAKRVSKWRGFKTAKKLMSYIVSNNIQCIGLAAPQLNIHERVFVLWDNKNYAAFINPKIIEIGVSEAESAESCLSIPGKSFMVKRPTTIIVKDAVRTKPFELEGISARAWLHEFDHLNGRLISDIGIEVSNTTGEDIENTTS